MQRKDSKASGASQGVTAVYQRGRDDDSLWDDADLVRLWNAQLEQQKEKEEEGAVATNNALRPGSSDNGSVIPTTENDDEAGTEDTSSSSLSASPARVTDAAGAAAVLAPTPMLQGDLGGLPPEIQRVAVAYYRAGYEAGHYVGVREQKEKRNPPKRTRNS
ncbi:hypothetical protein DQ04_00281280 [Trypanosoma grayi]|uniref:hypothetical protein n=1 Tax=Trypanosoma grayi TaxID=71804 RepID=UPI0004F41971|nr:hypothetical protein DQ04_00281280 [Trypanosoma grayi]KEG14865.1 hypothetical protein DQ04_00281280 [Trypanosoma grayi]